MARPAIANHKSKILAAIHETAADLRASGLISRKSQKVFDTLCLSRFEPTSPKQERAE